VLLVRGQHMEESVPGALQQLGAAAFDAAGVA
jgi:hypothetical protein